ncbi:MAG: GTP cyclohydrolase II [Candidatus Bilamarchaeaceae archaeon]
MIKHDACASLMTPYGEFNMHIFKDGVQEQIALVMPWVENESVLVRIHSKCITGEVFESLHCDCRAQLELAKKMIGKEGGLLIYLDHEGRGIGLGNKIRAYALQQERGYDTVDANAALSLPVDARDYSAAIEIIRFFGISKVRLLTNNPDKITALEQSKIEVQRVPLVVQPNEYNRFYLETKERRMGHDLGLTKETLSIKLRKPEGKKEVIRKKLVI